LVDEDEGDLDWGVIAEQNTANWKASLIDELKEFRQDGDNAMRKNWQKVGLSKNITSCWMFNPEIYFEPEIDKEYVDQMLVKAPKALVFYMEPTIPKNLGEENVRLIRDSLAKLKAEDENVYNTVCNDLLEEWEEQHTLKNKHFMQYASDANTDRKVTRVVDNARKLMNEDFKKRLGL
jgi:hypothetical protein